MADAEAFPPDAYPESFLLTPDEPIDLAKARRLDAEGLVTLLGRILSCWPEQVSAPQRQPLNDEGCRIPGLWTAFDEVEEGTLFNPDSQQLWLKLLGPLEIFAVQVLSWEVYVVLWRRARSGATALQPQDLTSAEVFESLVGRYAEIVGEEPALAALLSPLVHSIEDED